MWLIFTLWSGILFVLLSGALFLILAAFRLSSSFEDAAFYSLGASALLALPSRFAWNLFCRWTSKLNWWPAALRPPSPLPIPSSLSGTRPPGWRQATPWSWFNYRFRWAGYAAFERTCPFFYRAVARALLAVCGLFLLAIAWSGTRMIVTGVSMMGASGSILVLFGVCLLALPAFAVRTMIRRVRAGSLRTTAAELERLRAERTSWRLRELRRALSTKIAATVFLLAIYTLWWLRVFVHHSQHPHESRLTPLLWTPFLLYRLWAQFHRPKNIGES